MPIPSLLPSWQTSVCNHVMFSATVSEISAFYTTVNYTATAEEERLF
jgi:hypothetical protein